MNYMYLYLMFKDLLVERRYVKRFSAFLQEDTVSFYYEEANDERGKGKRVKGTEIERFAISPWPLSEWDAMIEG